MVWKPVRMRMLILFIAALVAGCGNSSDTAPSSAEPVQLVVSAAASLTDALLEIEHNYEADHPDIELRFNFGASGALQRQIEQGAPVDLFFSAAPDQMQALIDQGLVERGQHTVLLTNELVVVTPANASAEMQTLADLTRNTVKIVALGIPESVPAGGYAKEALLNASLWDTLSQKTVQGKDVRQVLHYVETGNADAGFVYRTDAWTSKDVKIAFAVDPQSYSAVAYPVGIVHASKRQAEAGAFYRYLQSKEVLDLFAKYGFTVAR